MTTALIVVDVQRDFCEGGALPVPGGNAVAEAIQEHLVNDGFRYDLIVATKDWHLAPGEHFQDWPIHCVAGTAGAQFHPAINPSIFDEVVYKGEYKSAYSGFEGHALYGQSLLQLLIPHKNLVICGLAEDFCVAATANDARRLGWSRHDIMIPKHLTAPVYKEGMNA